MQNSSILKILKSLNKTEFRELGKFVASPFFNNRSELIRFYYAVKPYYPKFSASEFTDEKIFMNVYPGKKYSGVLMRKLISLLNQQVLDYMAIKKYKTDLPDYNTKLMEELSKRKLDMFFEKRATQTEILLKQSKHNLPYYYYKHRHSNIVNAYSINRNMNFVLNNLQKEANDFTEYFIAESLEIYSRLSNFSQIFNKKFELGLYEGILAHLKSRNFDNVTLISLYHNILLLFESSEEKYFFELKKIHLRFESKLERLDEYNLFTVLFNYCIKRIQEGDLKFRYERFELDRKFIEKRLIQLDEYIELYSFLNAVTNAAVIKEFHWAAKFINDFIDKLNPIYVVEAKDLSLAIVEFYKENYNRALEYLSKIDLEFCHLKIDVKNLLLRIYYEKGYFIELESLIDAYKHYLKREKKLTNAAKKLNGDFIKYTSKLINLKETGKRRDINLLRREIEHNPYFRFKDWVLLKVNELLS